MRANSLPIRWLPVILWMALIFIVSSTPVLPTVPGKSTHDLEDIVVKKLGHAAEYAILGALLFRALAPRRLGLGALICAGLVAGYAVTDEFHQFFVPQRSPSLVDLGIDTVGGSVAAFLYGIRWMSLNRASWRPMIRRN